MTFFQRLLLVAALMVIPRAVAAADLVINPVAGQTSVGSMVTTTIQVDTAGSAVNAVEVTLTFPTDRLKLIAVSKADSILTLASIDSANANTTGQMVISGGLPSPGYEGDRGTILKATWEARAPGQATIQLTDGKILANDGEGTNILQTQSGATFMIVAAAPTTTAMSPPVVGSLDWPNETGWYSQSAATIFWTHPPGLDGVSYSVTREPGTVPDESIETTENAATIPLSGDGMWYFHLRGNYGSAWSETTHYTLRQDTRPPEPFDLELRRDRGAADPSPSVVFRTTDQASGLMGYTISIDGSAAAPATSPWQIVAARTGEYQVVVTATDQAGNTQVSTTTFTVAGYAVPIITTVSTPLIVLAELTVRGTALAGDRVNIFVDGKLVGSTMAGTASLAVTDGTIVRLPWTFTTDQPFGPGEHRVTATATGASGQTSIASDPRLISVRGSRIVVGGRTIGMVAAIPLLGLFIALIMAAVTWLVWRLRLSLQQFEARQTMVDQDLRTLRRAVDDGQLSTQGIEDALAIIDDEVVGRRPNATRTKRRSKKTLA